MLERLRRLLRDLAGRNDQVLVDHLLGQVDAAADGVRIALGIVVGDASPRAAIDDMEEAAGRGDRHRHDLVVELAAVLATPMDREDLFRLSRSTDDVLDNLADLVREMDLFGIGEEPLLVPALEGVAAGLDHLRAGVRALAERPHDARAGARAAKHNDIRRAYQRAVADLLGADEEAVTGRMVKQRMLLRRADVIGLRLGEAADALADGTIKRND